MKVLKLVLISPSSLAMLTHGDAPAALTSIFLKSAAQLAAAVSV